MSEKEEHQDIIKLKVESILKEARLLVDELFSDCKNLEDFILEFNRIFSGPRYETNLYKKLDVNSWKETETLSCIGASILISIWAEDKSVFQPSVFFVRDNLRSIEAHVVVVLRPSNLSEFSEPHRLYDELRKASEMKSSYSSPVFQLHFAECKPDVNRLSSPNYSLRKTTHALFGEGAYPFFDINAFVENRYRLIKAMIEIGE